MTDRTFILALWRAVRLNETLFWKLIKSAKQIPDIFQYSSDRLRKLGADQFTTAAIQSPCWDVIETEIKWAKEADQHIFTWRDKAYPDLLKQTREYPPVLYVKGNLATLTQPCFAIAGSRVPTNLGYKVTCQFTRSLSQRGLTLVNSRQRGIAKAMREGLKELSEVGFISIVSESLDRFNAAGELKKINVEHVPLVNETLISEVPFEMSSHTLPDLRFRYHRLVSGVSLGVLVVEASLRCEAMQTAFSALHQNREVFAIPGAIDNILAKGCHRLISQGAKLVGTVEDILEEIRPIHHQKELKRGLSNVNMVKCAC